MVPTTLVPELSEDALVEVFSHLDYLTLITGCSSVCKLWNIATKSEKVWKAEYEREFGRDTPPRYLVHLLSEGWSWRELFTTVVATMR